MSTRPLLDQRMFSSAQIFVGGRYATLLSSVFTQGPGVTDHWRSYPNPSGFLQIITSVVGLSFAKEVSISSKGYREAPIAKPAVSLIDTRMLIARHIIFLSGFLESTVHTTRRTTEIGRLSGTRSPSRHCQ